MLAAFDWVAAVSLLGAAWFAFAALEGSLLGVWALDCAAGAAAEEEAELVESIEFPLVDGLVFPDAAGADELLALAGVEALDWFIADASLEPLGVAAAEEGEVVLPAAPLLLPVVQ